MTPGDGDDAADVGDDTVTPDAPESSEDSGSGEHTSPDTGDSQTDGVA